MLLFKENHEDVNVIHMVMGEETDFQLNMAGQIIADISEMIDPSKKNIFVINRCTSEEELQNQIEKFTSRIAGKIHRHISNGGKNHKNEKEDEKEEPKEKPSPYGELVKDVRCPQCFSWGTRKKDGAITMCDLCRKIEEGLKNKDIPVDPTSKQKDDIVKTFFEKKNSEKRSGKKGDVQ